MICVGVDASTSSSGYSVFNGRELIAYGRIRPKGADWRERIIDQADTLDKIMSKYKPARLYMEDVPLKPGASTAMKLGAVQGCILTLAHQHQIDVQFLLPANWRSPLNLFDGTRDGTHREVLKEKAIQMVNEEFGLRLQWRGAKSKKSEDDVAESVLVAWSQIK